MIRTPNHEKTLINYWNFETGSLTQNYEVDAPYGDGLMTGVNDGILALAEHITLMGQIRDYARTNSDFNEAIKALYGTEVDLSINVIFGNGDNSTKIIQILNDFADLIATPHHQSTKVSITDIDDPDATATIKEITAAEMYQSVGQLAWRMQTMGALHKKNLANSNIIQSFYGIANTGYFDSNNRKDARIYRQILNDMSGLVYNQDYNSGEKEVSIYDIDYLTWNKVKVTLSADNTVDKLFWQIQTKAELKSKVQDSLKELYGITDLDKITGNGNKSAIARSIYDNLVTFIYNETYNSGEKETLNYNIDTGTMETTKLILTSKNTIERLVWEIQTKAAIKTGGAAIINRLFNVDLSNLSGAQEKSKKARGVLDILVGSIYNEDYNTETSWLDLKMASVFGMDEFKRKVLSGDSSVYKKAKLTPENTISALLEKLNLQEQIMNTYTTDGQRGVDLISDFFGLTEIAGKKVNFAGDSAFSPMMRSILNTVSDAIGYGFDYQYATPKDYVDAVYHAVEIRKRLFDMSQGAGIRSQFVQGVDDLTFPTAFWKLKGLANQDKLMNMALSIGEGKTFPDIETFLEAYNHIFSPISRFGDGTLSGYDYIKDLVTKAMLNAQEQITAFQNELERLEKVSKETSDPQITLRMNLIREDMVRLQRNISVMSKFQSGIPNWTDLSGINIKITDGKMVLEFFSTDSKPVYVMGKNQVLPFMTVYLDYVGPNITPQTIGGINMKEDIAGFTKVASIAILDKNNGTYMDSVNFDVSYDGDNQISKYLFSNVQVDLKTVQSPDKGKVRVFYDPVTKEACYEEYEASGDRMIVVNESRTRFSRVEFGIVNDLKTGKPIRVRKVVVTTDQFGNVVERADLVDFDYGLRDYRYKDRSVDSIATYRVTNALSGVVEFKTYKGSRLIRIQNSMRETTITYEGNTDEVKETVEKDLAGRTLSVSRPLTREELELMLKSQPGMNFELLENFLNASDIKNWNLVQDTVKGVYEIRHYKDGNVDLSVILDKPIREGGTIQQVNQSNYDSSGMLSSGSISLGIQLYRDQQGYVQIAPKGKVSEFKSLMVDLYDQQTGEKVKVSKREVTYGDGHMETEYWRGSLKLRTDITDASSGLTRVILNSYDRYSGLWTGSNVYSKTQLDQNGLPRVSELPVSTQKVMADASLKNGFTRVHVLNPRTMETKIQVIDIFGMTVSEEIETELPGKTGTKMITTLTENTYDWTVEPVTGWAKTRPLSSKTYVKTAGYDWTYGSEKRPAPIQECLKFEKLTTGMVRMTTLDHTSGVVSLQTVNLFGQTVSIQQTYERIYETSTGMKTDSETILTRIAYNEVGEVLSGREETMEGRLISSFTSSFDYNLGMTVRKIRNENSGVETRDYYRGSTKFFTEIENRSGATPEIRVSKYFYDYKGEGDLSGFLKEYEIYAGIDLMDLANRDFKTKADVKPVESGKIIERKRQVFDRASLTDQRIAELALNKNVTTTVSIRQPYVSETHESFTVMDSFGRTIETRDTQNILSNGVLTPITKVTQNFYSSGKPDRSITYALAGTPEVNKYDIQKGQIVEISNNFSFNSSKGLTFVDVIDAVTGSTVRKTFNSFGQNVLSSSQVPLEIMQDALEPSFIVTETVYDIHGLPLSIRMTQRKLDGTVIRELKEGTITLQEIEIKGQNVIQSEILTTDLRTKTQTLEIAYGGYLMERSLWDNGRKKKRTVYSYDARGIAESALVYAQDNKTILQTLTFESSPAVRNQTLSNQFKTDISIPASQRVKVNNEITLKSETEVYYQGFLVETHLLNTVTRYKYDASGEKITGSTYHTIDQSVVDGVAGLMGKTDKIVQREDGLKEIHLEKFINGLWNKEIQIVDNQGRTLALISMSQDAGKFQEMITLYEYDQGILGEVGIAVRTKVYAYIPGKVHFSDYMGRTLISDAELVDENGDGKFDQRDIKQGTMIYRNRWSQTEKRDLNGQVIDSAFAWEEVKDYMGRTIARHEGFLTIDKKKFVRLMAEIPTYDNQTKDGFYGMAIESDRYEIYGDRDEIQWNYDKSKKVHEFILRNKVENREWTAEEQYYRNIAHSKRITGRDNAEEARQLEQVKALFGSSITLTQIDNYIGDTTYQEVRDINGILVGKIMGKIENGVFKRVLMEITRYDAADFDARIADLTQQIKESVVPEQKAEMEAQIESLRKIKKDYAVYAKVGFASSSIVVAWNDSKKSLSDYTEKDILKSATLIEVDKNFNTSYEIRHHLLKISWHEVKNVAGRILEKFAGYHDMNTKEFKGRFVKLTDEVSFYSKLNVDSEEVKSWDDNDYQRALINVRGIADKSTSYDISTGEILREGRFVNELQDPQVRGTNTRARFLNYHISDVRSWNSWEEVKDEGYGRMVATYQGQDELNQYREETDDIPDSRTMVEINRYDDLSPEGLLGFTHQAASYEVKREVVLDESGMPVMNAQKGGFKFNYKPLSAYQEQDARLVKSTVFGDSRQTKSSSGMQVTEDGYIKYRIKDNLTGLVWDEVKDGYGRLRVKIMGDMLGNEFRPQWVRFSMYTVAMMTQDEIVGIYGDRELAMKDIDRLISLKIIKISPDDDKVYYLENNLPDDFLPSDLNHLDKWKEFLKKIGKGETATSILNNADASEHYAYNSAFEQYIYGLDASQINIEKFIDQYRKGTGAKPEFSTSQTQWHIEEYPTEESDPLGVYIYEKNGERMILRGDHREFIYSYRYEGSQVILLDAYKQPVKTMNASDFEALKIQKYSIKKIPKYIVSDMMQNRWWEVRDGKGRLYMHLRLNTAGEAEDIEINHFDERSVWGVSGLISNSESHRIKNEDFKQGRVNRDVDYQDKRPSRMTIMKPKYLSEAQLKEVLKPIFLDDSVVEQVIARLLKENILIKDDYRKGMKDQLEYQFNYDLNFRSLSALLCNETYNVFSLISENQSLPSQQRASDVLNRRVLFVRYLEKFRELDYDGSYNRGSHTMDYQYVNVETGDVRQNSFELIKEENMALLADRPIEDVFEKKFFGKDQKEYLKQGIFFTKDWVREMDSDFVYEMIARIDVQLETASGTAKDELLAEKKKLMNMKARIENISAETPGSFTQLLNDIWALIDNEKKRIQDDNQMSAQDKADALSYIESKYSRYQDIKNIFGSDLDKIVEALMSLEKKRGELGIPSNAHWLTTSMDKIQMRTIEVFDHIENDHFNQNYKVYRVVPLNLTTSSKDEFNLEYVGIGANGWTFTQHHYGSPPQILRIYSQDNIPRFSTQMRSDGYEWNAEKQAMIPSYKEELVKVYHVKMRVLGFKDKENPDRPLLKTELRNTVDYIHHGGDIEIYVEGEVLARTWTEDKAQKMEMIEKEIYIVNNGNLVFRQINALGKQTNKELTDYRITDALQSNLIWQGTIHFFKKIANIAGLSKSIEMSWQGDQKDIISIPDMVPNTLLEKREELKRLSKMEAFGDWCKRIITDRPIEVFGIALTFLMFLIQKFFSKKLLKVFGKKKLYLQDATIDDFENMKLMKQEYSVIQDLQRRGELIPRKAMGEDMPAVTEEDIFNKIKNAIYAENPDAKYRSQVDKKIEALKKVLVFDPREADIHPGELIISGDSLAAGIESLNELINNREEITGEELSRMSPQLRNILDRSGVTEDTKIFILDMMRSGILRPSELTSVLREFSNIESNVLTPENFNSLLRDKLYYAAYVDPMTGIMRPHVKNILRDKAVKIAEQLYKDKNGKLVVPVSDGNMADWDNILDYIEISIIDQIQKLAIERGGLRGPSKGIKSESGIWVENYYSDSVTEKGFGTEPYEDYVLRKLLQLEMKTLNGEGRMDEYLLERAKDLIRKGDGSKVIPMTKTYYNFFIVAFRRYVEGKGSGSVLQSMREVDVPSTLWRYFFQYEDMNDLFRYGKGMHDTGALSKDTLRKVRDIKAHAFSILERIGDLGNGDINAIMSDKDMENFVENHLGVFVKAVQKELPQFNRVKSRSTIQQMITGSIFSILSDKRTRQAVFSKGADAATRTETKKRVFWNIVFGSLSFLMMNVLLPNGIIQAAVSSLALTFTAPVILWALPLIVLAALGIYYAGKHWVKAESRTKFFIIAGSLAVFVILGFLFTLPALTGGAMIFKLSFLITNLSIPLTSVVIQGAAKVAMFLLLWMSFRLSIPAIDFIGKAFVVKKYMKENDVNHFISYEGIRREGFNEMFFDDFKKYETGKTSGEDRLNQFELFLDEEWGDSAKLGDGLERDLFVSMLSSEEYWQFKAYVNKVRELKKQGITSLSDLEKPGNKEFKEELTSLLPKTLTTNVAKLRIRRWANDWYRHDRPATPDSPSSLASVTAQAVTATEDFSFDYDSLNKMTFNKVNKDTTTRLGMLSHAYRDEYLLMVDEMKQKNIINENEKKQLLSVFDVNYTKIPLSGNEKARDIVTRWANERLQSVRTNQLTADRMVKPYQWIIGNYLEREFAKVENINKIFEYAEELLFEKAKAKAEEENPPREAYSIESRQQHEAEILEIARKLLEDPESPFAVKIGQEEKKIRLNEARVRLETLKLQEPHNLEKISQQEEEFKKINDEELPVLTWAQIQTLKQQDPSKKNIFEDSYFQKLRSWTIREKSIPAAEAKFQHIIKKERIFAFGQAGKSFLLRSQEMGKKIYAIAKDNQEEWLNLIKDLKDKGQISDDEAKLMSFEKMEEKGKGLVDNKTDEKDEPRLSMRINTEARKLIMDWCIQRNQIRLASLTPDSKDYDYEVLQKKLLTEIEKFHFMAKIPNMRHYVNELRRERERLGRPITLDDIKAYHKREKMYYPNAKGEFWGQEDGDDKEVIQLVLMAVNMKAFLLWLQAHVGVGGAARNKDDYFVDVFRVFKYSAVAAGMPWVTGESFYNWDADMHLRLEDGWAMPSMAREYIDDPRLGVQVPYIEHYVTRNLSITGKSTSDGENAFTYHSQLSKELTDSLLAYGKLTQRTAAVMQYEGLAGDSYVAEDAAGAMMYRVFGFKVRKANYFRHGKGLSSNLGEAKAPMDKWSGDSGELAFSGMSQKMMYSKDVSAAERFGTYGPGGSGLFFYLKKPYIIQYLALLWIAGFVFMLNPFLGLTLGMWAGGLLLSQTISFGLLFNNVINRDWSFTDKVFGRISSGFSRLMMWFGAVGITIWEVVIRMYPFFIMKLIEYDLSVGKKGAKRVTAFVKTGGKGAPQKISRDWRMIYLRHFYNIRYGALWTVIMLGVAPFHPYLFALWAPIWLVPIMWTFAHYMFESTTWGRGGWDQFWKKLIQKIPGLEGFQKADAKTAFFMLGVLGSTVLVMVALFLGLSLPPVLIPVIIIGVLVVLLISLFGPKVIAQTFLKGLKDAFYSGVFGLAKNAGVFAFGSFILASLIFPNTLIGLGVGLFIGAGVYALKGPLQKFKEEKKQRHLVNFDKLLRMEKIYKGKKNPFAEYFNDPLVASATNNGAQYKEFLFGKMGDLDTHPTAMYIEFFNIIDQNIDIFEITGGMPDNEGITSAEWASEQIVQDMESILGRKDIPEASRTVLEAKVKEITKARKDLVKSIQKEAEKALWKLKKELDEQNFLLKLAAQNNKPQELILKNIARLQKEIDLEKFDLKVRFAPEVKNLMSRINLLKKYKNYAVDKMDTLNGKIRSLKEGEALSKEDTEFSDALNAGSEESINSKISADLNEEWNTLLNNFIAVMKNQAGSGDVLKVFDISFDLKEADIEAFRKKLMEYFDTSKDLNSKVNIMAAINGVMEQMTLKTEILKQETSYERTLAIAEDFTALMNEGLGNILINPDLKLPVTLIVSQLGREKYFNEKYFKEFTLKTEEFNKAFSERSTKDFTVENVNYTFAPLTLDQMIEMSETDVEEELTLLKKYIELLSVENVFNEVLKNEVLKKINENDKGKLKKTFSLEPYTDQIVKSEYINAVNEMIMAIKDAKTSVDVMVNTIMGQTERFKKTQEAFKKIGQNLAGQGISYIPSFEELAFIDFSLPADDIDKKILPSLNQAAQEIENLKLMRDKGLITKALFSRYVNELLLRLKTLKTMKDWERLEYYLRELGYMPTRVDPEAFSLSWWLHDYWPFSIILRDENVKAKWLKPTPSIDINGKKVSQQGRGEKLIRLYDFLDNTLGVLMRSIMSKPGGEELIYLRHWFWGIAALPIAVMFAVYHLVPYITLFAGMTVPWLSLAIIAAVAFGSGLFALRSFGLSWPKTIAVSGILSVGLAVFSFFGLPPLFFNGYLVPLLTSVSGFATIGIIWKSLMRWDKITDRKEYKEKTQKRGREVIMLNAMDEQDSFLDIVSTSYGAFLSELRQASFIERIFDLVPDQDENISLKLAKMGMLSQYLNRRNYPEIKDSSITAIENIELKEILTPYYSEDFILDVLKMRETDPRTFKDFVVIEALRGNRLLWDFMKEKIEKEEDKALLDKSLAKYRETLEKRRQELDKGVKGISPAVNDQFMENMETMIFDNNLRPTDAPAFLSLLFKTFELNKDFAKKYENALNPIQDLMKLQGVDLTSENYATSADLYKAAVEKGLKSDNFDEVDKTMKHLEEMDGLIKVLLQQSEKGDLLNAIMIRIFGTPRFRDYNAALSFSLEKIRPSEEKPEVKEEKKLPEIKVDTETDAEVTASESVDVVSRILKRIWAGDPKAITLLKLKRVLSPDVVAKFKWKDFYQVVSKEGTLVSDTDLRGSIDTLFSSTQNIDPLFEKTMNDLMPRDLKGKKLTEAKTALFIRMAVTHPDIILTTLDNPEIELSQGVKDEISKLIRDYSSVLDATFEKMILTVLSDGNAAKKLALARLLEKSGKKNTEVVNILMSALESPEAMTGLDKLGREGKISLDSFMTALKNFKAPKTLLMAALIEETIPQTTSLEVVHIFKSLLDAVPSRKRLVETKV